MKKTASLIIVLTLAAALLTGAAAAGTITFEGIPETGAWVYADSKLTIPVNLTGYENGLSSFRLVLTITGASVTEPPTYQTTNGNYVEIPEPHYVDTWSYAHNQQGPITDTAAKTTTFILTHSGLSIYDGPFGKDPFQIGTLTLNLEDRRDLAYIYIHAYATEAYDNDANPVSIDKTIRIASRPYPKDIIYYNSDFNEELSPVTPLVENQPYGNITACVYEEDKTKNLYDATLGDQIIWIQMPAGSRQNIAELSSETTNPTFVTGKNPGTAYLNSKITFPAPPISAPYLQYNRDEPKLWESWTNSINYLYKLQTGVRLDHLYILEIPADFSLSEKEKISKLVRLSDFTIADDEQLNVQLSSNQFDTEINEYRLHSVKNPAVRVNYTIETDGTPIKESPKLLLKATEDDIRKKEGIFTYLNFTITERPELNGSYRDKLTFQVSFTPRPIPTP